jgi:hypothetical protein
VIRDGGFEEAVGGGEWFRVGHGDYRSRV